MKILLIQETDWLKRNPHQQHHLMDRMSVKGHEIRVIDYPFDWRKEKEDSSFISKRKIFENVHKVNTDADITLIRPPVVQAKVLDYVSIPYFHGKEIKKQIKEFQPDVIILFGLLNSYIASKIAKSNNIPIVYYFIDVLYTLIPEKAFQSLGKHINKKTIKNSDLILTINQRLAEQVIEIGANPKHTEVIPAGIEFESYDPEIDDTQIRKEYNISSDDTVLFFMGFIYDFAGMKELAIDLGENKDKYPNIKIVIVGDGDAYEDMLKIQKEYQLENQLILTGRQPYTRIPEFVSMADFCLLPAYQDEIIMQDIVPIKIYEYLAMEKPVIATKLPGIYKEFGENHGILYVDGAEEVLNTVQKILNEGNKEEIGKTARNFVKDNDWKDITNIFEDTLNKFLSNYKK